MAAPRLQVHGIGTDASMATHVTNVVRRDYVALDPATRALSPTPLGLGLVHAYMIVQPRLVLPSVRARVEAECDRIARGEARFAEVVPRLLAEFEASFHAVAARLELIPQASQRAGERASSHEPHFCGLARELLRTQRGLR